MKEISLALWLVPVGLGSYNRFCHFLVVLKKP
jgi:hypothetical protein